MSNIFKNLFKNIASKKNGPSEEMTLLDKIEHGFDNNEFKMYLQFIVDSRTRRLFCAEALSRWETESGEVIFPGDYIGLMESSGLIVRFDYYMFNLVCAKLSEWKGTALGECTISCNFTRITISERDFVSKIKEIADKYDFDREKLLIEITEDSVERNIKVAMDNIRQIRALGFSIALDDIGSGYTSLISLCEYPIDIVKIDREVLLLAESERGRKLLCGIVTLAHSLGLRVICEGVETEEQNSLVVSSGCDYIQGWYYSRAMPECKCEQFASDYNSNLIGNN